MKTNGLEEHRTCVDVILCQKETVHETKNIEGGRLCSMDMVCEATSVVCGAALRGVQLEPAGVLLAHWEPSGCNAALALRYVQASEPEPVSQVCEPVTHGAIGEPARGRSKVGPLVRGSELTLESEVAVLVMCELVSMIVVPVPAVFGVDTVEVDSAPRVVDQW